MACTIKPWVEHFLILPLKWYRLHCRSWAEMQQRCKMCGCRDKFDFHIQDEIWAKVIPEQYQKRVVCLACFDDFAKKKGVEYSTSLKTLYFAGSKASLRFEFKPWNR